MKRVIYLLATILFITSCEPSIEDYMEQWNETEGQVYNYADNFPSFKGEILAQYEKAKPLWEKVDSSEDEDVKKAQMKLAITTAKAGALKKIMTLENKIASVEQYERTFRDLPSDEFSSKTTLLINDANELTPKAKEILNGTYNDLDSAYALFGNITNRLMAQENQMRKHHDEIKRKRQEEKRAEELRQQKLKEKEAPAQPETAEIETAI